MMISKNRLNFLKNNNFHNLAIFSIFLIFFSIFYYMSISKINNFSVTFYDTGYYANILQNDLVKDKIFLSTHLSFILIPLSYLLKIFPGNILYQLIIIQIICGLIPIFFLKRNYFLIFSYILCPIVWFNLLPNFHIDIFAIPLIWFLLKSNDEHNFKKFLIFSIILISIKFIFSLIIFGIVLFNYFENKKFKINKYYSYVISILFLYFLIVLYYYFSFETIGDELLSFKTELSTHKLLAIKFIDIFLLFLVCFGYFLFLPILKSKHFLIIIPLFFVYSISPNNLNLIKFYYHYTIPLIPVIFYSINNSLNKSNFNNFNLFGKIKNFKISKKFFLINFLIFNTLFSPSPFSLIFWKDYNYFYSKNNYKIIKENIQTHKNVNEKLNLLNNKKNIVIENNLIFKNLFEHNIKVFPDIIFETKDLKKEADFIFLRMKGPYFLSDQICLDDDMKCQNTKFKNLYNENLDKLANYEIFFKDKNIKVLKKKY